MDACGDARGTPAEFYIGSEVGADSVGVVESVGASSSEAENREGQAVGETQCMALQGGPVGAEPSPAGVSEFAAAFAPPSLGPHEHFFDGQAIQCCKVLMVRLSGAADKMRLRLGYELSG